MTDFKTFWFSQEEITNLWSGLQEAKDRNLVPVENLQNIYDELSVASVRAHVFIADRVRMALSLGHEHTAIPLRFTEQDYKLLNKLPLALEVKEVLR